MFLARIEVTRLKATKVKGIPLDPRKARIFGILPVLVEVNTGVPLVVGVGGGLIPVEGNVYTPSECSWSMVRGRGISGRDCLALMWPLIVQFGWGVKSARPQQSVYRLHQSSRSRSTYSS